MASSPFAHMLQCVAMSAVCLFVVFCSFVPRPSPAPVYDNLHYPTVCIFNELQAVGSFLAFDGASMHTNFFTSGKKYRKLVNNAVFIRNESLCFVSVVATIAFN